MADTRPLRADALRNREKILDAARAQITRYGIDVPMDDIAEAAGVAVGTLYRHYPTKTALVGAVLAEHFDRMADEVEAADARVAAGAKAMTELTELITRTIRVAARDHAMKAATQGFGTEEYTRGPEERGMTAMHRLISVAKADGELHPDVTVEDFMLLLSTVPLEATDEVRERWLTLVLPGFTTAARPIGRSGPALR